MENRDSSESPESGTVLASTNVTGCRLSSCMARSMRKSVSEDSRGSFVHDVESLARKRARAKSLRAMSMFGTVLSDPESRGTSISRANKEDERRRPYWTMRFDYYILLVAATLGMSNALDFPSDALNHGRGTFIILYFVISIFVGIPLMYLDVSWGQFSRRGPIEAYNMAPLFKGIGLAVVIGSFYDNIMYPVKIVYSGCYIFSGNLDVIYSCGNSWNTPACIYLAKHKCARSDNQTRYPNGTCYSKQNVYLGVWNITAYEASTDLTTVTAGFEYLRYYIQGGYSDPENALHLFDVQGSLLLGLACLWFISFILLRGGVKSLSKVMAFPVLLPQITLMFLLIRGAAQHRSSRVGEIFLEIQDWSDFLDSEIYFKVFERVMYSLGIGYGALITLSSYNKLHESILRPVVVLGIIDMWTSLMMGIIVFSFMGDVSDDLLSRVGKGESLVFEAYALSSAQVDNGALMTATFFTALTLMGTGAFVATEEVTLAALSDNWPRRRLPKYVIVGAVCVLSLMLGIPFVTRGGYYLQLFVSSYISAYTPFIVTFCNLLVVLAVYGYKRYQADLEVMIGKPPPWLVYSWLVILFVLFTVLTIRMLEALMVDNNEPTEEMKTAEKLYGNMFGQTMGWLIYLIPLVFIPIVMLVKILRRPGHESFCTRVKALLSPSLEWMTPKGGSSESLASAADPRRKESVQEPTSILEPSSKPSDEHKMKSPESSDSDNVEARHGIIKPSNPKMDAHKNLKVSLSVPAVE